ncbi:His Kinase A (phospho-acceptor) domain-containing protein [Marinobacter sp. LV10R510-11A]|uniref:sensor histidine kinase n=1 Tax=Marinobacter sp. LV10R510-11A TaxID=1415568 RepID=UPI000BB7CB5C|nr:ATP-binding protein [Marinobacter sp. LV10R510-11A]SOB77857.1 His Kinase A (phospho-acceptor) domain-containing protein [Marinobacter sp. LV10R510-11A]
MRNFDDDPKLNDLLSGDQLARLNQCLSALCSEPVFLSETRSVPASVPVEFNLETVGWLSGGSSASEREAAASMTAYLMMFVAKYRLAANLHYDATEAGYAELQRRNEALIESESRYRELSDQLQQKVDEQVDVIRKTQQELYDSARLRSVGQLAAGVAHEINNPIGFISSNLRVAKDYVRDLEEMLPNTPVNQDLLTDFTDLLTESIDGARRIASIVADLKTFSSIDQADYSRCDINSLLTSAIHLVQTEYNHELQITEELKELPAIDGHPSRLSQTFFNLLDNAAQATREAEAEKGKGRILVKTLMQGSDVQVIIQDNGCGIPEENRKRVFDAFFTSRPVGSGTGLGLTVAQDTVRAHSGRLQIDTREGTGTRVLLTLPIN